MKYFNSSHFENRRSMLAGLVLCGAGTLLMSAGCGADEASTEEIGHVEAAHEADRTSRDDGDESERERMSAEERMAAAEARMKAAVESGRVDHSGGELRLLWMKLKMEGSEEVKAEMDALVKPFTAEKKNIRAAIKDQSLSEEEGKAQLDALHQNLMEEFETLAAQLEE